MSKVKDAVTLVMLLVAIVFSAGLLTLPEYSSAGLDISGLPSAAPAGETCLKLAAEGRPVASFNSLTSCHELKASSRLM